MIKKSAKIYLTGFVSGFFICYLLILIYPPLYLALVKFLIGKIEAQIGVGRELHLSVSMVIILNNLFASFLSSYGGYALTKIYLSLGSNNPSDFLKKLRIFDKRVGGLPANLLKYCLSLYFFPVLILYLNGFVLGIFLIFYFIYFSADILAYVAALLPHGIFEIPGIIISGGIGLQVAENSLFVEEKSGFKNELENAAKKTISKYLLVILLLVTGGIIEGSRL